MAAAQRLRGKLAGQTPRKADRIPKWARRLEQENDRLRTENAALREESQEARSFQKRMLEALESRPVVEVKKRRRAVLPTLLIAGGACIIGMRLGRERYEQMVAAAKDRASAAKERLGGSEGERVVTVPQANPPAAEIEHEPEMPTTPGSSTRSSPSR
jgi:hypothetical protein